MRVYLGIDVETTGLDMEKDPVLSIGLHAFDHELVPINDGIELVRSFTNGQVLDMYAGADPFVQNMHTVNGLWQAVEDSTLTDEELRMQVCEYIDDLRPIGDLEQRPGGRAIVLTGSSVKFDWFHLMKLVPEAIDRVNYRVMDVTTLKLWAQERYGLEPMKKDSQHTPLSDIMDSIEELDYINNQVDLYYQRQYRDRA